MESWSVSSGLPGIAETDLTTHTATTILPLYPQYQAERPQPVGPASMEVEESAESTVNPLHNTQKLFEVVQSMGILLEKSKVELKTCTQKGVMLTVLSATGNEENALRQSTKREFDRLNASEAYWCKINGDLQKENEKLREELRRLQERDELLSKTAEGLQKDNQLLKHDLFTKEQEHEEFKKESFSYQEASLQQSHAKLSELQNQKESLEEKLSRKTSEYNKLADENNKVTAELLECKTRLSKVMGNKLSNNNPAIADLSDKNRPTKLAEKYQELYDNQWTDAFERVDLHFKDEQKSVQLLKQLLQDIKEFYEKVNRHQIDVLYNALNIQTDTKTDIPDEVVKHIKDVRKATAELSVNKVYEQYLAGSQMLKNASAAYLVHDEKVQPFVYSCVEICLLMSLQDPPLAFEPDPASMEQFDTNKYKYYTQTGSYVHFVVWPAMLLHEGGPVLSKGTAQAFPSTDYNGQRVPKGSVRRTETTVASNTTRQTQDPPQVQTMDRSDEHSNSDRVNSSRMVDVTAMISTFHTYDSQIRQVPATTPPPGTSYKTQRNKNTFAQSYFNKNPTNEELQQFKSLGERSGYDGEQIKAAFGDRYEILYDYFAKHKMFNN